MVRHRPPHAGGLVRLAGVGLDDMLERRIDRLGHIGVGDGDEVVLHSRVSFNSISSMTTGVFAWMPWRRPAGMWTQVPGFASCWSSPSITVASPWRKCRTAGIE